MSVTEIVRTVAGEGKAAELKTALAEAVRIFPSQPGCLGARALQPVESEDANVFFLLIEWESVDAHLKWRDSSLDGREWFKSSVRPLMGGTNLTGHFIQYAEA
jgi:heme-degrading monooxygenase HmoA